MKKIFSKENGVAIFLSVVASVVFSRFVEPLMDVLGKFGNHAIEIAVNHYYVCCADATSTKFIHTIAYIVFMLGVAYSGSIFLSVAFPHHQEQGIRKKEEIDLTQQESKKELHSSNIEDKISKLEKIKIRKQRSDKIISRVLLIAFLGWFLYMNLYIYSPVHAKNNFDKKIIQITPYVDNIELAHLNADWVNMETQADYLALNEKIEGIMEANGINRR